MMVRVHPDPLMPPKKGAKAKTKGKRRATRPSLPKGVRRGTVLAYVKYRYEDGWWPDVDYDPDAFLGVQR